ncbi:MAG: molecular chaperone DnaJ [Myxococcales bacterium]|nr:MAG: molecular chaperone DnaJ [Myxococcales bacterium]
MSEKRDFYEVLGVAREASDDDIRKAYRQCALKHHPDRNQGNPEAEVKFREATEAFSVLSDAEKRAAYDRFGHAGLGGGGFDFNNAGVGDILSHFQDMFSDFFGGGGGGFAGGGGRRRRQPDRGQDVRVELTLTLAQALTGGKHEVSIHGAVSCETCHGSGAKAGTKPETCNQCRGTGQVTAQRGFIMFSSPCARCRGTGQTIAVPCDVCRGQGAVEKQRKVLVNVPAGIDTEQRLRVPGQGMPGPGNSPAGDLYVDIEVEADSHFERHGNDLGTRLTLSFAEAALGMSTKIIVPDGREVTVKVDAGCQPGSVVVVKGEGAPRLDRGGRGDLHVMVAVQVPKKLSKNAKRLLQELESELKGETEQSTTAS